MKQLSCELCGGNELRKEDGVYKCLNCGTSYTLEEAKKMFIDGVVDIKGTVKVDNTEIIDKYLKNAQRARSKEDWQEAERYYNLVEENDPDNIEAIFYSAYAKAKVSLIEDDVFRRQSNFKILSNCLSLIDDRFRISEEEKNKIIIRSIANDLCEMFKSTFTYRQSENSNTHVTYLMFFDLAEKFRDSILNISIIEKKFYLFSSLELVLSTLLNTNRLNQENTRIIKKWIDEVDEALLKMYWEKFPEKKSNFDLEIMDINNLEISIIKDLELIANSNYICQEITEINENIREIKNKSIKLSLFEKKKLSEFNDIVEKLKIKKEKILENRKLELSAQRSEMLKRKEQIKKEIEDEIMILASL